MIKVRPYLTFNGQCQEAIELYKRAFQTDIIDIMRFSDLPPNPKFELPEECQNLIVQATLKFGDDFIRLSDCWPSQPLNEAVTDRISIAVETDPQRIQHAFDVLAEQGEVGMALEKTFYSPLAGVVYDPFGVMWNLVGQ